jgi:hypothetical protein
MSAVMTAIYGGGSFYPIGPDGKRTDLPAVIADLKASGFTTVVEWGLQLSAATSGPTVGDLQLNEVIVSNGVYVGDPGWPAALAGLKTGTTSVNRLLFSLLGYQGGTFPRIKQLIESQGTGPDSILYRNFAALKHHIPTIDGIDFDDETLYDQDTTVKLALMLKEIGYSVTFCPFDNMTFWVGCLAALEARAPGLVTGFNLQCYAGGAGQDPGTWAQAIAQGLDWPLQRGAAYVIPGLWCGHGDNCGQGSWPNNVFDTFRHWRSSGIQGGFIWLYADIQKCKGSSGAGTKDYAAAMAAGLTAADTVTAEPEPEPQPA